MANSKLATLPSYTVLKLTYKSYKDTCQLVAFICNTLSSNVALLEVPKSLLPSSEDLSFTGTRLEALVNEYLQNNPQDILLIENSKKDARLTEKTERSPISLPVFIAIIPIKNVAKKTIGILYIQDSSPKTLSPEQCKALLIVANQTLPYLQPEQSLEKAVLPRTTESLEPKKNTKKLTTQQTIQESLAVLNANASTPLHAGYMLKTVLNINGTIDFVNSSFCYTLDYPSEELLGKNIFNYIHPEDREKVTLNFSHFVEEKPFIPGAYRIKHKSGSYCWFEVIAINRMTDPDIQGIVIKARDITKRIALKASEEKYRLLFDNSPSPKYIFEIDSLQIIDVNEAMIALYGYPREELLTMTIKELRPLEEVGKLLAALQSKPQKEGSINYGIFTHQKKNGDILKIDVTGHYFRYNNLNCLMVTCKDVTEKEQRRQALKLSEQKLKTATAIAKLGYWSMDLNHNSISWSDEMYAIWERDKTTFVLSFENFLATIHPRDQEKFLSEHFATLSEKKEQDLKYRILLASGQIKWVHGMGRLIKDSQDNSLIFEGTVQDISQIKKEEQELRLLESVVTNATDAVMITEAEPFDEPGPRILYVNDAFTAMTGYAAEEVLGKSPRILQGPKTDKIALKKLGEAMRRWKPCETTVINYKKNGEEFWNNFSLNPVADETGMYTHWISIERDVTKQKNLETQKQLLTDISVLFSQQEALQPCLKSVLALIVNFKDFTLGEIWLPDSETKQLRLVATYTEKDCGQLFYANSKEVQFFDKGQGLPGMVWEKQRVQKWDNLQKRDKFIRRKALANSSMDMAIGIPLIHSQELVGILVVGLNKKLYHHAIEGELFEQISIYLGEEIKRKRLEIELDQVFKFAPDIICTAGTNGYFKKINPAASRILGYSEEELLSRPILDFVHPDDREITVNAFKSFNLDQRIKNFKNRYISKSGKTVWLKWNTTPAPEMGMTFAVAEDITETKKLQELLDMANNLAEIGSWEINLETNEIYWSAITKQIHEVNPNYQPSFATSKDFYKENFYWEKMTSNVQTAINKQEAIDYDMPIITAKGNERWVRVIGKPEFKEGKCVRIYGSIQNIQKLKLTQLSLQKAFKENNRILESIGEAFISVDRHGVVTYFNKYAEEYLEISRREIVGQYIWDVIPKNNSIYDKYKSFENHLEDKQKIHFEEFHPESKKMV